METGAPYLRIVAEIRDRITRGQLRPGEKIPSTRQITQEWGVAMATATKVITTLRDEGVVDTRPGAGTVVRSAHVTPPIRKVPREQDLGRERIVRAAIAVADAEGLAMVSMRRVATDLDVATMSLYRHVSSKDVLMLQMADTVFAEEPFPAEGPSGWRARLEFAAGQMWKVCRRHPWAAEVLSMTRPQVMPNLLVYAEWTLGVLRGLGLATDDMMHIHLNLFGHVRGMAIAMQAEVQALRDTGMTSDEWMDTQTAELDRAVATGRYPTMRYVATQDFDYQLDKVFDYGLQLLLDGVEQKLDRAVRTDG